MCVSIVSSNFLFLHWSTRSRHRRSGYSSVRAEFEVEGLGHTRFRLQEKKKKKKHPRPFHKKVNDIGYLILLIDPSVNIQLRWRTPPWLTKCTSSSASSANWNWIASQVAHVSIGWPYIDVFILFPETQWGSSFQSDAAISKDIFPSSKFSKTWCPRIYASIFMSGSGVEYSHGQPTSLKIYIPFSIGRDFLELLDWAIGVVKDFG